MSSMRTQGPTPLSPLNICVYIHIIHAHMQCFPFKYTGNCDYEYIVTPYLLRNLFIYI